MPSMEIIFPQWRAENETTNYPFAEKATMTNGTDVLLQGTFVDASLFPIGGGPGIYLSKVTVNHDTVTITIGDPTNDTLATGSFDLVHPPNSFKLVDNFGRPAGIIVSEPSRLALLGSLGVGEHAFQPDASEFAATVCVPTPQIGVRGIQLADGTVMTGDVWFVGDDGIVLRPEVVTVPSPVCGQTYQAEVIRVDVIGDPLFRRRLCQPASLFATPTFLTKVTFRDREQEVVCRPNQHGDIKMTVNNALTPQPVLRIHPSPNGNVFEVVGSVLQGVHNG